jgi:hypothetical protein
MTAVRDAMVIDTLSTDAWEEQIALVDARDGGRLLPEDDNGIKGEGRVMMVLKWAPKAFWCITAVCAILVIRNYSE